MIAVGLDANIVVRLIMQDDPAESARAREIFGELTPSRKGHICQLVQAEIWWVLRRAYKLTAQQATAALQGLLESDDLELEQPADLAWALERTASGADLADALIYQASSRRAPRVLTFDKKAADRAFGLEYAGPVHLVDPTTRES
ncbi:MAG: type II toxin-antitoxin system VapC family toxin [Propionibacteriaceae bacterium]|nr:type II toxin-antitoxin system VapC family toxin [Propionibacteriaceae bacterium]